MVAIQSVLLFTTLLSRAAVAQSTASSAASSGGTVTVPASTVTTTIEVSIPRFTNTIDTGFTTYVDGLFPPCARLPVINAYNESRPICGMFNTLRAVRHCVCNHPRFIAQALYGCEVTCHKQLGPRWRMWWLLQRECRLAGVPLGGLRAYVDFELMEFQENDPSTFGNQTYSPPDVAGAKTVTDGTLTVTEWQSTTALVALKEEQTSNIPAATETGVPTSTLALEATTASSGASSSASASGKSAATASYGANVFQVFGVSTYALVVAIAGFVFAF